MSSAKNRNRGRSNAASKRKPNATGRSETVARFVMLEHWVLNSAAYKSLPAGPRALLTHMAQFHNGRNNGEITYSARQGGSELHASKNTAAKWLTLLEDRGFIVRTSEASFDFKTGAGAGIARQWRLTMYEGKNGAPASKEFLTWQPVEKSKRGHARETGCPSPMTAAA